MDQSTACVLADCERAKYQNKDYCGSHFMKFYRYGDPYYVAPRRHHDLIGRRFGALVVTERVGLKWICLCDCGVTTETRSGDLNRGSAMSCGDHVRHSRRRDDIKYHSAHVRVKLARGRARQYACVDCGGKAAQWSYDHGDPDELISYELGGIPYSLLVDHYDPRCIPCHKVFDLGRPGRHVRA